MPYIPGKLPALTNPDAIALAQYLEDELQSLASGLIENVTEVALSPLFAAPKKPREGMVVYADGTLWNPGSGEGLYVYSSGGTWIWLEDNPSVPSLPLSIANGGTADSGTVWASYSVTVTVGTGTATATGNFKTIGKTVFINVVLTFSTAITGVITISLPVAAARKALICGEETAINAHPVAVRLATSSAVATLIDMTTFGAPTANGSIFVLSGTYESV